MTEEPVFCHHCGAVDEELNRRLNELEHAVMRLGLDLARKQGLIARLRKIQVEEHPPEYEDAMEVAEHWRRSCRPGAKELGGKRLRNTIDRLRAGHPKEDLLQAIDGYAARPNMRDYTRCRASEGGVRRDDLELIMRDEQHIQAGIDIAVAEMVHDQRVLDGGGSRYVAALCGCGHPLVSHQLFWQTGATACAEKECACAAFDTLPVETEQWLHKQGYYQAQRAGRLL